jgi:hypothetical protein
MNDNMDQHTPDETVPIKQQRGDYVADNAIDDIIDRLLTVYWIAKSAGDVASKNSISAAIQKIEQLQHLGDELASHICKPCKCIEAHDGAINETCEPCAAAYDWDKAKIRPRHAHTKWETIKANRATPSDTHKLPKQTT